MSLIYGFVFYFFFYQYCSKVNTKRFIFFSDIIKILIVHLAKENIITDNKLNIQGFSWWIWNYIWSLKSMVGLLLSEWSEEHFILLKWNLSNIDAVLNGQLYSIWGMNHSKEGIRDFFYDFLTFFCVTLCLFDFSLIFVWLFLVFKCTRFFEGFTLGSIRDR